MTEANWDHFKVICKGCAKQITECPCKTDREKFTRYEHCDDCLGKLQSLDPSKLVSPAKPKKVRR